MRPAIKLGLNLFYAISLLLLAALALAYFGIKRVPGTPRAAVLRENISFAEVIDGITGQSHKVVHLIGEGLPALPVINAITKIVGASEWEQAESGKQIILGVDFFDRLTVELKGVGFDEISSYLLSRDGVPLSNGNYADRFWLVIRPVGSADDSRKIALIGDNIYTIDRLGKIRLFVTR